MVQICIVNNTKMTFLDKVYKNQYFPHKALKHKPTTNLCLAMDKIKNRK